MVQNTQIRKFHEKDLQSVYRLIQNTIDISYHKAYPKEAIEFFKDYHSEEHILNDAVTGYTVVAECESDVLGTGTLFGTNIRRVFVNPLHQCKGIGRLIVQDLERRVLVGKIATLDLEASLVSRQFWESMGFTVQREDYVQVRKGQKLCYYRMIKTLSVGQ